MQFLAWFRDLSAGRPHRPEERTSVPSPEDWLRASGDASGSYGFGHRAHRPDPRARYRFDNDPNHWAPRPSR